MLVVLREGGREGGGREGGREGRREGVSTTAFCPHYIQYVPAVGSGGPRTAGRR